MGEYLIKETYDVSIQDNKGETVMKANTDEIKNNEVLQSIFYPHLMNATLNTVVKKKY